MVTWIRHLLSIVVLPFTMAVVIPAWLWRRNHIVLAAGTTTLELAVQAVGIVLAVIGLGLFASSLRRFATEGDGTLAPWDPPRRLVLNGPYRYVRNPMISGVAFVLFGEAFILQSRVHLEWALAFAAVNLAFIVLFEEPQLRRRFGSSYVEYCRHVRRFVPRLSPWQAVHADDRHR